MNWKDVIKEDLVDREDHWGFGDLKPENFVIEKNTDTLYLVDFDTYNPRDRKNKLLEWNKYLKKSVDEIVENERIDLKNKFWSS